MRRLQGHKSCDPDKLTRFERAAKIGIKQRERESEREGKEKRVIVEG